jgi:hypothetical protein
MCLYPTLIKNRKYTANKKNGGNIPPMADTRTEYVPIGCQDCIECRKQKAREWQTRLQEHIKTNNNGKFITLTFSNEKYYELINNTKHLKELKHIPQLEGYQRDNALATAATRLFLERWRKKYKKSLPHWLITELGHNGTENIHIHGIIWTNEPLKEVEKIWSYGYMWKGKEKQSGKIENYVNAKTVNYIIKYITKKDERNTTYKSIILTTAGIGNNYTTTYNAKKNKYNAQQTNETYKTTTGHKIAIPIYWRNKIYTEQEREKLWLQKLDKQEKYVLGNKIDISTEQGEKDYYTSLKTAQKVNAKLGYGNGQKTWEQKQYEQTRRNLLNEKRKMQAEAKIKLLADLKSK